MKWYLDGWRRYADFTGRSPRRAFWTFTLVNLVILFLLAMIEGFLGGQPETDSSILASLFDLAILVPTGAIGARRMHDIGRSGWWFIVPIVNVVLALFEGSQGENQFGHDPRATET